VHFYTGKIQALLELQIQELGGIDSLKASITKKIFLNKTLGEKHSHYLQKEMQTLHQGLNNSVGVFPDWWVVFFKG